MIMIENALSTHTPRSAPAITSFNGMVALRSGFALLPHMDAIGGQESVEKTQPRYKTFFAALTISSAFGITAFSSGSL